MIRSFFRSFLLRPGVSGGGAVGGVVRVADPSGAGAARGGRGLAGGPHQRHLPAHQRVAERPPAASEARGCELVLLSTFFFSQSSVSLFDGFIHLCFCHDLAKLLLRASCLIEALIFPVMHYGWILFWIRS